MPIPKPVDWGSPNQTFIIHLGMIIPRKLSPRECQTAAIAQAGLDTANRVAAAASSTNPEIFMDWGTPLGDKTLSLKSVLPLCGLGPTITTAQLSVRIRAYQLYTGKSIRVIQEEHLSIWDSLAVALLTDKTFPNTWV